MMREDNMGYNNDQFLQFYQSSNLAALFSEACKPLLGFGFKEVSYIRVYSDNSIVVLTTASLWLNNWLTLFGSYDLTLFRDKIRSAIISVSDVYCAWQYIKQDPLLEFNHHYKMDQGFDIYRRKKDYVELWSFIAKDKKSMFYDFCINNLGKLEEITNLCVVLLEKQEYLFFAKKALIPLNIASDFDKKFLTYREIECTRLVVMGSTAKEIARNLNIAPKTVEVYLSNIRQKQVVIIRMI
jgi:DNA-binding CsgD family transcriptional regulator